MTPPVSPDQILADWVARAIAQSGLQVTEIAAMLNMSRSTLSKIKGGQQQLKASQLLMLAERLNVPIPRLTAQAPQPEAKSRSVEGFDRALFDRAHAHVVAENEKMPSSEQMDPFQILENSFHVYSTLISASSDQKGAIRT